MKKIFYFNILLILIGTAACEKTIIIDSRQTSGSIVIDGLITNVPGKQYVKLSRTASFYESGETMRVTNAIVTVSDDMGNEISFIHNPDGKDENNGFYFPTTTFTGQVGHTYKLAVTVGPDTYEAEDKMLPVTTIDSLSFRVNETEKEDPEIANKYYELLTYMKEPQETEDYYLFKYYRNDSITYHKQNSDIYFTNDVGIGQNIDGFPSPVFYEVNDKAEMEIYSLSKNAFLFYSDLYNLINSDGGMTSPPPANPRTNLSNGALGFFRTSAVHSANITIK